MNFIRFFTVHEDRMERDVSLVKVINSLEEAKQLISKQIPTTKVLNSCYIVVDRDGDFVDACSGRLPPNTLDAVIDRVIQTHPENGPFRLLKWNGYEFVEIPAVS